MMRGPLAVALVLAALAAPGPARGARSPACSGVFVVDGDPLLPGDTAPAVIELGRTVAVRGRCEPVRVRETRRRGEVVVRARWRRCGATRAVRLRATLDWPACGALTGTLRTGAGPRPFTASRGVRALVFTRTAGFRHASIADAQQVLGALPASERVFPTLTEDPAAVTDRTLIDFDVLVFVNTTGDVLDEAQQAAVERFVRAGRGWVGVHSAADTEYGWPWYGRLVGAYFTSHPLLPVTVTVTTEDGAHPATAHLEGSFSFTDEIYNFDRNPRLDNAILLTIDEAGFTFPNFPFGRPSMGADHPVAWYKEFEGGRSFYTNLGHRSETWRDPLFAQHLLAGIRWAAGPNRYNRIPLSRRAANPMALAVAPDGRVFHVERTGEVHVYDPRTGRTTEAARLAVDTTAENGLLGVALDPDFAATGALYLYSSDPVPAPPPASGPPGENVLRRVTLGPDGTIDVAAGQVLLRVPSERQCCHEGGGLAFGPDGTLYLSVGDNTNPFASAGTAPLDERPGREGFNSQRTAANPFDLRGKILRLDPGGSIPPGNLFPPDGSLGRPEIYVMGARNPFRIAVDPATGRLFWGDVGPDGLADSERGPRGYDEINYADRPGNYGWPYCIGDNRPYADYDFATDTVGPPFDCGAMVPALLAYDYFTLSHPVLHTAVAAPGEGFAGRTAIAGVVLRAPAGAAPYLLPPPFVDTLLMAEWGRDLIATVTQGPAGTLASLSRLVPWERFHRPIDLDLGPDGALYVLEYGSGYFGNNTDAQVSRIEYSATGALTPVAAAAATPTAGVAPLAVTLSAAGSRAPGAGDRVVRYEWDVDGDGRTDSRKPRLARTFRQSGRFPVTLTVVGASGRRSFPSVVDVVVGNRPPEVTIVAPADGAHVPENSLVTLEGAATDAEDGTAPCDRLVWDIRLGHNAHTHPIRTARGCTATFIASVAADHAEFSGVFYAVELTYTDDGAPDGVPPLTGRQGIRIEVDPPPAG